MKRILLFTVFVVFVFLNLHGEIKYKVSGKVLRNGVGFPNYKFTLFSSEYNISEESNTLRSITKRDGTFTFYLQKGKYYFLFPEVIQENYFLLPVGPREITVSNKNISNLIIKLYKFKEIIDANIEVLNSIPLSFETITYKYGKIPIFSKEKCTDRARRYLNDMKEIKNSSNILSNSVIGEPIIFYDLDDNPVYYQYPIRNLGVDIGYFGICAIGVEPSPKGIEGILEISLDELKLNRQDYFKKKTTLDNRIPRAKELVVNELGYSISDIEFRKFIYLDTESDYLYAQFRIKSKNEIILVNLIFPDLIENFDQCKKDQKDLYQLSNLVNYIKEIRFREKKLLMN